MNEIIPFYKFRAEAGDEPTGAELLIFDVIGNWEDIGEVGAKAFAKDLAALPKSVKRLDIHINSPGGSVSEANAIYSRLADHPTNKNVYVDGIAASAATLVAMVGHKIFIRANATMMVHLPMALALGNADDMRKTIAALESVTESMLNLYARRTGGAREDIRALLAAETWMSADMAVEKGFADEVRGVVKAAALVGEKKVMFNGLTFDLSRFHNVPALDAITTKPTQTNMENPTPPAAAPPPAPGTPPAPGATANPPANPQPPGTPPPPQPAPPTPPTPPPTGTPPAATSEREQGILAERARIAALQKWDRPATHDIIAKAIADGKTLADIQDEVFAALEKASGQQQRREDARIVSFIPGGDAPTGGSDPAAEFATRLTNAVQAKLGARAAKKRPVHGNN